MEIDIGSEAVSQSNSTSSGYTLISKVNPANKAGYLTRIEIYAKTNIGGAKVGTFYQVSGNTYKCRDSAVIGDVSSGSKQSFTELSIEVQVGDFIGIYFSSGSICNLLYSGDGYLHVSGDYCDPDDQTTYTDSDYLKGIISLYGDDFMGGAVSAPASITYPETDSHGEFEVSWDESENANNYTLEVSDDDGESWDEVYNGSGLSDFQSVESGEYIYRVKASNDENDSDYTTGDTITVDYTPVTLVKSENIAVKVSEFSGGV